MFAFIRYQLISYIRSFRFIAPITIFLAWVFITYAYKNIPIMSSYATTSVALYIVMTWIGMNVFSLEDESEKHILFINLGGKQKYFLGKWAVCFIFIFLLFLFSHFYPILTDSFREEVSPAHHMLSFYCHVFLGLFGVFIGSLFSATRFSRTRHAWLMTALVIVFTIAEPAIIKSMPYLQWGFVIFPPVTKVISPFYAGDNILLGSEFWLDLTWVIAYGLISFIVARFLFLKYER